jgi:hypothetical protein
VPGAAVFSEDRAESRLRTDPDLLDIRWIASPSPAIADPA